MEKEIHFFLCIEPKNNTSAQKQFFTRLIAKKNILGPITQTNFVLICIKGGRRWWPFTTPTTTNNDFILAPWWFRGQSPFSINHVCTFSCVLYWSPQTIVTLKESLLHQNKARKLESTIREIRQWRKWQKTICHIEMWKKCKISTLLKCDWSFRWRGYLLMVYGAFEWRMRRQSWDYCCSNKSKYLRYRLHKDWCDILSRSTINIVLS